MNCQIISRKQNPLYIPKIKFGNGQGGHVLVVSALKCFPFKKCTYVKSKSVEIYLYFLPLLSILLFLHVSELVFISSYLFGFC